MRRIAACLLAAATVAHATGAIRFVVDDPAIRGRGLLPQQRTAGRFTHSHSYLVMRDLSSGKLSSEVHVVNSDHPGAVRRQLAELPSMPGMLPEPLTRREQLVTMAEMMVTSFPDPDFDLPAALQPLFDAKVPSRFANTTSADTKADSALRLRYAKAMKADLARRYASVRDAFIGYEGGRTIANELGVACDVYTSSTGARVIHFRGSYSNADFNNIRALYGDWFGQPSRDRYQAIWADEAKLTVTDEMAARASAGETVQSYLVRMEFNLRMPELVSALKRGLELGGVDTAALGINDQGIDDWGMWEITRAITRREVPRGTKANASAPVYLTGFSQGGARAQLAALLLAHEDGVRYNTTTMAATGVQCASKSLFLSGRSMTDAFFGGSLGDHSDHVVTYTHVLDPYAAIDYNVGTRCVMGTRDVAGSFVEDFCGPVVGYSLGVAGGFHGAALGLCTFSTHNNLRILARFNLSYLGYLNDDGTTDGGCKPVPDMTEECQIGPPAVSWPS